MSGAPSLLVVDDDPTNLRLLVLTLRSVLPGAAILGLTDGAEAVSIARARRFDLVLLDCMLPGLDGFEAAAAIRGEGSACQRVPIIAVTAGVDDDAKERCERAGMDALLEKPFNREGLRGAVSRWLQPGGVI